MLTKSDLINELRKTTKSTIRSSSLAVDTIFEIIFNTVSKGKSVKIENFGNFQTRTVAAKRYPSLRKGNSTVDTTIPEHNKIVFKPCKRLKEAVNEK